MTVDREIWKKWFSLDDFKSIPCPLCQRGHFLVNKNNVYQKVTVESEKENEVYGDPLNYEGRFYALIKCNNCNDHFHLIGMSAYEEVYKTSNNGYPERDYELIYKPVSFYPAPHLIKLSSDIPVEVKNELEIAFAVFWQDFSASGNRIRTAVERILDDFKIPRYKKNRTKIMLHGRINEFKKRIPKYAHLFDQLMAIKWLGNEGSHTTGLDRNDIFDALDLLEFVLDELYNGREKQLQKLAKKINRRKGSVYTNKRKSSRI